VGQVKPAVLETNGKWAFSFTVKMILSNYACGFCGNIEKIESGTRTCNRWHKDEWVLAINTIRIFKLVTP
jgi:hypothetical protein